MPTRLLAIAIALVCAGCSRKEAPASAAAPSSCDVLGQKFCEGTPVGCDAAKQMFANAELKEADCADALRKLETAATMPADTRAVAMRIVLLDLMEKSPKITPEQVAAIEAQAHAKALAAAGEGGLPTDVTCPGVATRKGAAPPDGDELWCETADGNRQGPAVKWNARGEPIRRAEYEADAIVQVHWMIPTSGEIPQSLFVCPKGETRKEDTEGTLVVLRCMTAEGRTTAELGWQNGKTISLLEEDAMGNRFAGYMNAPE
jgi:hypothetical protein